MDLLHFTRLSVESNRAAAAEAGNLRRRGARAARQLTRFTVGQRSGPRDAWEGALEVLKEGVSGEESKGLMEIVLSIVDSWLALARSTQEIWQDVSSETGAVPEGLEDVAEAEKDVLDVKASAGKMLAFLTRERPPVDPERLRKGMEEAAAGKVKTIEELRSRFPRP